MTKKDYILLASIIQELDLKPAERAHVAEKFATRLRQNYKGSSSFATEKFIEACKTREERIVEADEREEKGR